MRLAFSVMLLLAAMTLSQPMHAEPGRRIEEILRSKNSTARVRGCFVTVTLDYTNPCASVANRHIVSHTERLDLRALKTNPFYVGFTDFTFTRFESLRGAVTYDFRSEPDARLRTAGRRVWAIRDAEMRNYPHDVESRLRVLATRFQTELDFGTYAMAYEVTKYCEGIEVRKPLHSGDYSFFLDPANFQEFAMLIANQAATCDEGPSG